ncbi:hypothetical protein JYT83_01530 [bacterium AH-315-F18]|nr:hypothetical protein [bacterium AH-315-F18]
MSLYLTVFNTAGEEIDGWVFGRYSDFSCLIGIIANNVDAKVFPILMTHSDCDGEWSSNELSGLRAELRQIKGELLKIEPRDLGDAFIHTAEYRTNAKSLADCFHNVDGENIFDALTQLCEVAETHKCSILFQ